MDQFNPYINKSRNTLKASKSIKPNLSKDLNKPAPTIETSKKGKSFYWKTAKSGKTYKRYCSV